MAYAAALTSGEVREDVAQDWAVGVMDDFARQIESATVKEGRWPRLTRRKAKPRSAGFYLYGEVGRGKSMLMDLFFSAAKQPLKRRVHFHQFMLEIHERLHKLRNERVDDVLAQVARDIAYETRLLCFDEFHVTNIADAMILERLFAALFEGGVVIVLTSNWSPDELYKNGLQRDRFLPFIEWIKQTMLIHRLAGAIDHRYEQLRNLQAYFSPLGGDATRKLQGIFLQLTGDAQPESVALPVQGRTLNITHAAKGVGFFNFDEVCTAALGPADYLAIAECLHTVLLDGVPQLTADRRNETIRFMTFVDTLYEAKVKFFMAAAAAPEKLAPLGEYGFAFQRTLSRLKEMQGEDYRRKPHIT
jgi:cell division protein ZapE